MLLAACSSAASSTVGETATVASAAPAGDHQHDHGRRRVDRDALPHPLPPATVADLLALGRPIVLAHTGGEDEFPGSTMFAFGESMKAGVDMLDLNVQLTHDGVLVIQHDDTVDRTTTAPARSPT